MDSCFGERVGEGMTSIDRLLPDFVGGDTSWVSGGLMEGTRMSVKVLLSRLWRDREGRRAEEGVGMEGVHE